MNLSLDLGIFNIIIYEAVVNTPGVTLYTYAFRVLYQFLGPILLIWFNFNPSMDK